MLIAVGKFIGFGAFWFVMIFMAILLSTPENATRKTEIINYIIFVGGPLLALLGYNIYTILHQNLHWATTLSKFFTFVVLPLILVQLYLMYAK